MGDCRGSRDDQICNPRSQRNLPINVFLKLSRSEGCQFFRPPKLSQVCPVEAIMGNVPQEAINIMQTQIFGIAITGPGSTYDGWQRTFQGWNTVSQQIKLLACRQTAIQFQPSMCSRMIPIERAASNYTCMLSRFSPP